MGPPFFVVFSHPEGAIMLRNPKIKYSSITVNEDDVLWFSFLV